MDPALVILLWIVAAAMVGVGLAGAVLPVLPGVPLVFGGLWLAAWIDGYARVGNRPGIVSTTLLNAYYDSQESYLKALAREISKEYRAIVDAGWIDQATLCQGVEPGTVDVCQ